MIFIIKNLYSRKLNKYDLVEHLETTTSLSPLIFDFLPYKQIYRVAMGSHLGSALANAFLCYYGKEWLDNCTSHFELIIYRRYVDDIFVLFSSKEHSQYFVDYMNKQHIFIKFTSETEQNNTYNKPTFSGVFTCYESYDDQSYKKSLIFTFLYRWPFTCSDYMLYYL